MNERIKELSKASFEYALSQHPGSDEFQPIWTEKFAELIVKEMLQTCEDHPAWTGRMIGEQIKQYFGVK